MFPLRRRQVKYEQGQELRNAIPVLVYLTSYISHQPSCVCTCPCVTVDQFLLNVCEQ